MTSTMAALVRYALVGVVNAATYYAVYLLVLGGAGDAAQRSSTQGYGYLTAHVIGLGAAMVVSFLLNCRFTFRVRPTWRRFVLYPASQAVNIAATTVGVVALVTLGVDERIAPLVAAVLAVPVSFLAARTVMRAGGRVAPAASAVVDPDPDPATLRLTLRPPRRPVAGR